MSISLIQEKLDQYRCQSEQEESFALKEIAQEIALAALARSDFFKWVAFQGGTCLRILYGLNRFSEDLDFTLKQVNLSFDWSPYLKNLEREFTAFDLELKIQDRSNATSNIRQAFLKEDSIGKVLLLRHRPDDHKMKMIKIKFELDVNPPRGATFETKYIDFPFSAAVTTQTLPSLFAGKSHALLCRKYVKGRDWYDLLWYVSRKVAPNLEYLTQACEQDGPWAGQNLSISKKWYLVELEKKIHSIDWKAAKEEVKRFVRPIDLPSLSVWHKAFFLDRIQKMREYLLSS